MRKYLLFILSISLTGCSQPHYKNPHIVIDTNFGNIEAELYPGKAPKTVAAFLSYIDSGYYDHSAFYRVVKEEGLADNNLGLIQGGIWQTTANLHPKVPGIVHESTKQTGLSHTSGTLSLARTTPGTATTEFFICIGDQTGFDYGNDNNGDKEGFAAFGKVIKGMLVVREIQNEPSNGESFIKKIEIRKIKRL
jgi:peptidyl-prolyl cis-trans isomerase A (cyclophilin A)